MGTDGGSAPPNRKSVPTPYIDHDDALVMIDASPLTQVACIDAAVETGMRPVSASTETAPTVVATVRPLVIVVDEQAQRKGGRWTDLAVSVGAQLVLVNAVDVGPALAERVKLAGSAARALHARKNS